MKKRRHKHRGPRIVQAAGCERESLTLECSADVSVIEAKEGEAPKRPTVEIVAYNGGAIRPMFFSRDVVIDLAGLSTTSDVPILLDHDHSAIVGQSQAVELSKNSLKLSGIITGDTGKEGEPAAKVVAHAKNGFRWRASVGISVGRMESVRAGDKVSVNGSEFTGPLLVARSGSLNEVSLLAVAADRTSSAQVAASGKQKGKNMFEQWLEANGFSADDLSEQQETALRAAWKASRETEEQPEEKPKIQAAGGAKSDLDSVIAAAERENKRVDEITRITSRYIAEYPAQLEVIKAMSSVAVEKKMAPQDYELELLRAARYPSQPIRAGSGAGRPVSSKVVEAALCLAGGIADIEEHYDAATIEAANARFRSKLTICETLMLAARANGYGHVSYRDTGALLEAAFPARSQLTAAGPSTYDVSGILSNVANKFILQYFNAVDSEWRRIAATRPVSDFKQITSYSLTADMTYEEIPPGGHLKHGTAGEVAYTNQARSFGRMFGIDRRDLINDDLGAFTGVARKLGTGGALKFNDVFWTAFLDNATFFSQGNGNYASGADTALSTTALEAAEVLFLTQTDPEGKPLGVMPQILLVPISLKRTAMAILRSPAIVVAGDSDVVMPSTNTFAGDFTIASTSYLQSSAYPGSSPKKWYLLANPLQLPAIEACFLNGVQVPTVENAQANFDQLGIQMRGYFDFGVAKQEFRGGVAMAGQ